MDVITSTSGVVPRFLVLPLELTLLNAYGKGAARSLCHIDLQYCILEFGILLFCTTAKAAQCETSYSVCYENMAANMNLPW